MTIDTTPRRRPTQARAKVSVDALLEATARLLVEIGYDRVSTNKIARRAGVSVGTLYQYFPNKEALLAALVDRRMAHQSRVLVETMEATRGAPLSETIERVVRAILALPLEEPTLYRAINEQVLRLGALEEALDVQRRMAAVLAAQLERRRDEVRPRNLAVAAHVLVQTVSAVMYANATAAEAFEGEAVATELVDLIRRYLLSDVPSDDEAAQA